MDYFFIKNGIYQYKIITLFDNKEIANFKTNININSKINNSKYLFYSDPFFINNKEIILEAYDRYKSCGIINIYDSYKKILLLKIFLILVNILLILVFLKIKIKFFFT